MLLLLRPLRRHAENACSLRQQIQFPHLLLVSVRPMEGSLENI